MGRTKQFNVDKYIDYDKTRNVSICKTCGKGLSGKCTSNIKRHYLTLHRDQLHISDLGPADASSTVNDKTNNTITTSLAAIAKPGNRIAISMNKTQFISCCVGLVTVKNLPFGIFDDKQYFKKLLKPYEEHFKVSVDSKEIADEVNVIGNKIKQNIAQAVHKKMISLKFDLASYMEQNILVTNIQYMMDMKLCTSTIGVVTLDNTSDCDKNALCEEIVNCLAEFSIDLAQVYACVTDNGANMRAITATTSANVTTNLDEEGTSEICMLPANEESNSDDEFYLEIHAALSAGFQVNRCFTHTIQLIAQDVLETIEPQIDDCRQIIEFLRKNQTNLQLPLMDCETSWLSTYAMLNSLHSLKDCMDNINDAQITEIDWHFLSTFLVAFKPVAECSSKLQCEQYIVGDFYRDLMCCEVELDDLAQKGNFYAQLLMDSFKSKKESLLESETFLAALYMDPRFNFANAPFLNEEKKKIAVKHLLKTYETIEGYSTHADDKSNIFPKSEPLPNESLSPYQKLERKMSLLIEKTTRPNISMEEKLKSLSYTERLPFESNILEYWRSKKYKDLELGKLVDVALAVPSTQFSAGRASNALSLIAVNRQRSLSKDTLKNLLLINLNKASV